MEIVQKLAPKSSINECWPMGSLTIQITLNCRRNTRRLYSYCVDSYWYGSVCVCVNCPKEREVVTQIIFWILSQEKLSRMTCCHCTLQKKHLHKYSIRSDAFLDHARPWSHVTLRKWYDISKSLLTLAQLLTGYFFIMLRTISSTFKT